MEDIVLDHHDVPVHMVSRDVNAKQVCILLNRLVEVQLYFIAPSCRRSVRHVFATDICLYIDTQIYIDKRIANAMYCKTSPPIEKIWEYKSNNHTQLPRNIEPMML